MATRAYRKTPLLRRLAFHVGLGPLVIVQAAAERQQSESELEHVAPDAGSRRIPARRAPRTSPRRARLV